MCFFICVNTTCVRISYDKLLGENWLFQFGGILVGGTVMPLPSKHPWVTLSSGSLCEVEVGAPSPHPHTLSGMLPGIQSYWHCPGSFHTRTQYICQCLSHSRRGLSKYHRGPHHEAGSTHYQWMEQQEVVCTVQREREKVRDSKSSCIAGKFSRYTLYSR